MEGRRFVLRLLLLCGCAPAWSCWCGGAAAGRRAPSRCAAGGACRAPPALLQMDKGANELDGWSGSADGGTMFAAWDGRVDGRVSPEGMLPPGEDLVETDLRRLFDLEGGDGMLEGSEMDELQVCAPARGARRCARGTCGG
jgi:hypothetical protein